MFGIPSRENPVQQRVSRTVPLFLSCYTFILVIKILNYFTLFLFKTRIKNSI